MTARDPNAPAPASDATVDHAHRQPIAIVRDEPARDLVGEATRALTVIIRAAIGAPSCYMPSSFTVAHDERGVRVYLPPMVPASPEIVGNLVEFAAFCEHTAAPADEDAEVARIVEVSTAEREALDALRAWYAATVGEDVLAAHKRMKAAAARLVEVGRG